jgi:WD40 repeat protein
MTSGLAFAPDGKSLAAGYGDYCGFFNGDLGRVKHWEVEAGREMGSLPGAIGGVSRVAYAPDGKRLAVAGTGVVELWDLEARSRVRDFRGHDRWVLGLAFSPDGSRLATGGWDRTIRVWDATTGPEQRTVFGHEGFVLDLAFSPDGRHLASVSEDRSVRLWEVPTGREVQTFHGHMDFVQAVAFRPDGREVASGGMDGTVKFWDLRSSRLVVFSRHTGWVEHLAFLGDGGRIVSFPGRLSVRGELPVCWDPTTGDVDPPRDGVEPDVLDPNHARFEQKVFASRDGRLVAWAVDPNAVVRSLSRRGQEYTSTAVEIRDAGSGQLLYSLLGHSAEVASLVFSPDGRRLATASADSTVKLWDTSTGLEVFTLRGHSAGVISLAFSPDGHRLASGSIDTTARIWDATPLPAGVLAEHDARYRAKLDSFEPLRIPEDPGQIAILHALGRRWAQAAAAFGRAVAAQPDDLTLRYHHHLALRETGDIAGYQRAASDLLARPVKGSVIPVAWYCVLGPLPNASREAPIRLVEPVVADQSAPTRSAALNALGAAMYRAGRLEEAVRSLKESVQGAGGAGMPRNWAFLAMSYHRLGDQQEARRWLDKLGPSPRLTTDLRWDAVEMEVLRREAERLISGDDELTRASGSSAPPGAEGPELNQPSAPSVR